MPTWTGTPVLALARPLQRVAVGASAPTVCPDVLVMPDGRRPSASTPRPVAASAHTTCV
jgi:hypothetical protein